MPKLIPTRSADPGKPTVVIIGDGPGRLHAEGLQQAKLPIVLFDKYNHHCFKTFMHQVDISPETSSNEFLFSRNIRKNKDFDFRPGNVSQIKPNENFFYNKSHLLLIARPKDAVN